MEDHDIAIDALRHAVRTQPADAWCLWTAKAVVRNTRDFQSGRIRNGLYSWDFVWERLDALVAEGWLYRPDGVQYVPTAAAKSTWPKATAPAV